MKKLFTLIALLTCFLGASAKEFVDLEIDYSTVTSDWNGGWRSDDAATRVSIVDGCMYYHSAEATANFYDVQFQAFGVPASSFDSDASYTITIKIKGSVAGSLHSSFSGSNTPGDIPVTTDWQTVVLEGCKDDPAAQYFAGSGALLIQCGDYVGDWWISYVKITHEGKEERPVEWRELISNGGADTPWGDLANIVYTDTENTTKVCAWSKEKGTNLDDAGAWNPYPSNIVDDPDQAGNKVFIVDGAVADTPDEGDQKPSAWDNQFWIMSTKELKVGAQYKISFRYKASEAAKTNTQMHSAQPSDYLHYQVLGDINFTTEWQEFKDQIITIPTPQNNRPIYSIAFNLNPENKNAIKFYFDDLSICEMVLEEGHFVAASNTTSGLEYDFDNAVELTTDGDVISATVGTKGKKESWVNEVMISTVRGNDKAFKASTIKPTGVIDGTEETWLPYSAASSAKIQLPAAGVWKISIDTTDELINFYQVEGDAIVVKEAVDIVANETEIVIDAVEREATSGEEEGGTGNTWDNQFFLYSNRDLAPGEETIIEFEYKATKQANSSAAFQGVVEGNADYITGAFNLENDDAFDTEWKSIKKELKMPEKKWDGKAVDVVKYITFDLACIKEANTYTFKNIKWYLKDDNNANNQTFENLINATGTENFAIKIGAGTAPYQYGTDPSGIINVKEDAVKNNSAIYNLAGQRVSKDYKGIVVKNGKKYIVK